MSKKYKNKTGVVYSTNPDFEFQYEQEETIETLAPAKQNLLVYLDKKQRQGKTVTIIENFIGKVDDMEDLCKKLKTTCGTGGSVKEGFIIIQGDSREKVSAYLTKNNYRHKLR
jgi:translation initiation factor 1